MGQSRQLRPTGTLAQRLRAVEARLTGSERFWDLRLDLKAFEPTDDRKTLPTGPTILAAGGRWDSTFGRFLDPATEGDVATLTMVGLESTQLDFARFGAEWLSAYVNGQPRETSVALLAGDRRGGKSFVAVAFIIACCVDCPVATDSTPLIAWIVCKNYRERFQLEQWIVNRIPSAWYRHLGQPVHEFHFVHGSILRLISADDDDATKQGRVDVAFIDEPQKLGPRAIANAVLGASDLGGLVVLAANPPASNSSRGEWMFDLKEEIDDEQLARAKGKPVEPIGVRYFHFQSKDNKSIDQVARRRAGRIATLIDPSLKTGDVEGSWKRPGDRALWEFDKHRHLQRVPQVAPNLQDITRQVVRDRGEYGDWTHVAGVDFDWRPHIIAIVYRLFGDPDDPLFWSVDEFAGERQWTVSNWINEFAAWGEPRGYTPSTLLFVADASSSHPHKDDPKVEDERTAYETIQAAGWGIVPPQDHRGKTGRARNPFVDERLDLANEQLRRDRWLIDPKRCAWLAQCAREALTERKMGRRKLVHNKNAHAIDAATYPIWRLAPRAGGTFRPSASDVAIITRRPGGG